LRGGAQRDRHELVYVDEAHIHQDVDPGYGWGVRGIPFHVASSSPGLSAKVSFYGLYEPRRVSRRLRLLRGWSHGNQENSEELLA
jgi:hypothetical protein